MELAISPDTPVELDWLRRWALYTPGGVALEDADTGARTSYARLYELSCRLATELARRFGCGPGDRVAVFAANRLEYVPLFFAVARLGGILVPVNVRLTSRELAHIVEDSGVRLLVVEEALETVVAGLGENRPPTWSFDGGDGLTSFLAAVPDVGWKRSSLPPPWHLPVAGAPSDPVMILYTSGTTGKPKGALITHEMIFWNSVTTGLRLNLTQQEVGLGFLPFFHTGGWNVLLTPFLHRGAKTVLMGKFDPERVLRLCAEHGVTILFGVPTTMDMMARSPAFAEVDLRSVRYAIVGGEAMPLGLIETWQRKGVPIRQGYGLTEFGPNVFSLNEEDAIRKIGSIGFPNFYVDVRVVDGDDRDVEDEQIGELVLRGPMCTPGYWRNEEATRATIREGWLHTGDLVRRDSEGYFYVAGRKKEMFISGGENVYPVEIEQFLRTFPPVQEVAVIGVPDERWGEVGSAFIVLKPGARCTPEEVLAFCRGQLARYKIPKYIHFREELPKGESGKILKRALAGAPTGTTPTGTGSPPPSN